MKDIKFISILENQNNPLNSWKQIIEQEKINYTEVLNNQTKLTVTNNFNENKNSLLSFVHSGGVCIV